MNMFEQFPRQICGYAKNWCGHNHMFSGPMMWHTGYNPYVCGRCGPHGGQIKLDQRGWPVKQGKE